MSCCGNRIKSGMRVLVEGLLLGVVLGGCGITVVLWVIYLMVKAGWLK
jgi:hypothetical protein